MWIEPIFDRTQADVAFAAANRGLQPPPKGAISAPDRARIGGNIHFLADLLASYGTTITVNCQADWAREDFPSYSKVLVMYNDIERLQEGFARYGHCPLLSWNHYEKINQVERILFELRAMLARMAAAFRHCGTFYSGQGGIRV